MFSKICVGERVENLREKERDSVCVFDIYYISNILFPCNRSALSIFPWQVHRLALSALLELILIRLVHVLGVEIWLEILTG